MMTESNKICSKCGKKYPNSGLYFRKAKTCENGISNVCKECVRNYKILWKIKKGLLDRSYIIQPYEFIKDKRKKCILNRKTVDISRHRIYCDDIIRTAKIFRQGIMARSRLGKLPCDKELFSIDYFCELINLQKTCECCEVELDFSYKKINAVQFNSPTIDKIIPNLGYIRGNIAMLCWKCNLVKKDALLDELKTLLTWMKNNV